MPEQTIKPDEKLSHSGLYLDFLKKEWRLKKYLFSAEPGEIADKIGRAKIDREAIGDILERQNKEFGSKQRTFGSIEELREKDSLCVFSGQQAGLFGGPLLTLYKAIDTVKRAQKLRRELQRPVVPVFWIATDDHDFDEINHTYFVSREGQLEKIVYDPPRDFAVPVAQVCMDSEEHYEKLMAQARDGYGGTDFSQELLERLGRAYSFEKCLTKAFAQYMADILPDFGLVLFCPTDKEIKALSKDFFKRVVESYYRLKSILEETSRSLEEDNYHIQVEKKQSATHLFFHDPGRIPIHFLDDAFHLEDKRLGLPGMLDLIEKYPERFSSDVITRPIWQSYVFPVVAQIGGPAEIAYFCQIGGLFQLFDLVQPYYYARASATIVEKRTEELLERYRINLKALTGDVEQLINRLAEDSFPAEVGDRISTFRTKLDDDYESFMKFIVDYDKSLEPMARQTYGKIDFALNSFEKKIFAHHKRKMQTVRNQIYRLAAVIFPEKNYQERSLNINYFISRYGFGIVDHIAENLDIETTRHQLISLSNYVQ